MRRAPRELALFEGGADFVEDGADFRANCLNSGDDEDSDQGRNQSVLDRVVPDLSPMNFVTDLNMGLLLLHNIYLAANSVFLPPNAEQTYRFPLSAELI